MAGYIFEQGQRCACLIDPRGVRRAMRKAGARRRGAASRLPVGRRRSSLGALPGRSGKPDTRPKGSAVAASSPDKGGILQGFVKTALAALYKVETVISCTGIVTLALVSHFWPLPEPASHWKRYSAIKRSGRSLGVNSANVTMPHRAVSSSRLRLKPRPSRSRTLYASLMPRRLERSMPESSSRPSRLS